MEEAKKRTLVEAGINIESGLNRFLNNEILYEKFLFQFPRDTNMEKLRQALLDGACKEAFHSAHTLLGVAANLSLESLYLVLRPLTEALRNRNINLANELIEDVENAYTSVLEVLK